MGKQQEEEEKKDRAALLIQERKKIIYNLVLVVTASFVVLIGMLTIAWFTMNRDVGTSGMGISVAGPTFEVTTLTGSEGIFKDPYHIKVHDDSALYWTMTPTNNLINYTSATYDENNELVDPGDQGLHPGTEGVISFYVTPKVASVNLDFDFEIVGYQASTDNKGIVMTPLANLSSGTGESPRNLLNGHILLFEERTETTTSGTTTVTYSKPILSNADMHRVMNRTITGKDTATPVNIYWVWPNTLSTLVDASASGITTVPFTSGTSYTAITGNITSYPQYYLKGASSGITVADIGAHYDTYGDMYDQGDNDIGMLVHYVLIKLSVTEGTAGGSGSE